MKEEKINRDGRDGRDKYREKLINEKSFCEVLWRRLLFTKFQPVIPLEELALVTRYLPVAKISTSPDISYPSTTTFKKPDKYCVGLRFSLGQYETYSHCVKILRPPCLIKFRAVSRYDVYEISGLGKIKIHFKISSFSNSKH